MAEKKAHNRIEFSNKEEQKMINLYLEETKTIKSVALLYNVSSTVVKRILSENKIIRRGHEEYTRHSVNDYFFKEINTESKAYILGLLFADGNVSKSRNRIEIVLKNEDSYLLDLIKKELLFDGELDNINHKIYGNYGKKLKISSKKIKEDLINLGCVPAKSPILKFPTPEQVPEHLIHHFIRGYFDGDGCHGYYKTKYNTYRESLSFLGTHEFLTDLHNVFIKHLGLPEKNLTKAGNSEVAKSACYNCKQARAILCFMNSEATLKLERKHLSEIQHLQYKKLKNGN